MPGDGAPDGAPGLSVLPHTVARCAGASRRSIAAISLSRVRVSWFPHLLLPSRLQRQFGSSPCRALSALEAARGAVPVQRAPRRAVVMPPDRLPGRPGCGVTNPARGRRPTGEAFNRPGPLRSDAASPAPHLIVAPSLDVSRRRPRPSQARRSMKGQCGGNMEFIPIIPAREFRLRAELRHRWAGQASAFLRAARQQLHRFGSEADIENRVALSCPVANDPKAVVAFRHMDISR